MSTAMGRLGEIVLLLLVLVLFAGADARAATWDESSTSPCTVDSVAATQACAAGEASRACCAALRSPVGDGGLPCLCFVAERPTIAASSGVNISWAAELFAACGGGELATACHAGGAPTRLSHLAPPATTMGPGCNTTRLADEIADHCDNGASSSCCEPVITAVDIKGCFCAVTTERSLINAMASTRVLQLYRECGGIRRLSTDDDCEAVETNEEPSCSPPSPPPQGSSLTLHVSVATLVIVVIILAFVLGTAGWALYRCTTVTTEMRASVAAFRSAAMEHAGITRAYIESELARLRGLLRIPDRPNLLLLADRPHNVERYITDGRPRDLELAQFRQGAGGRRFSF